VIPILLGLTLQGQEIRVDDIGSLRSAMAQAKPGTKILLGPHEFPGGLYGTNINGTAKEPIILAALDPAHPPTFKGAIQFEAVSYLEVRDLTIVGVSGNAIGIDDNGAREKPAHHITLKGLHIVDAPGGGTNGIKMAGVDDFHIDSCTVERWGGCAIDLVGCHKGLIENCRFKAGIGLGVQAKGASADVSIRRCDFEDFGGRGVNVGGSTGNLFYRPAIESMRPGTRYEAKNITVEGCTFRGGGAPVAFVGCDNSVFRFNTIFKPQQWAMRILQETNTSDFLPSRNGRFEDNVVIFESNHWFEGGVNIGPGTSPDTFKFARNWWFCQDKPERSRPTLPSMESFATVGKDPIIDVQTLKLLPTSPARGAGAQALPNK
jgi:hypothetical protein